MAASLCHLATQLGASYNAILVGSKKDWDEYLLKHLGQITLAPSSLVVIEEIVESPAGLRSSDSRKGQVLPAIKGFTPLVLALPTITGLVSPSV